VLVGRDVEQARIEALLEGARASTSGSLVIQGEPGVGKTALLEDARERAAGMLVLTARGVESESDLPFAGLHQLLRPALGLVDRLDERQANALRGALGVGVEVDGTERFLAFAGCLSLLSEHAEKRPVLCLVDDAQWLDSASADALRFVARRLDSEGVVMLFGVREDEVSSFPVLDIPTMRLEGLDADSARQLLAQETGTDAARSVLDRLLAQTRGNALALLELPSVLSAAQLAGAESLPAELPLTRQVERVFLDRVGPLSPAAQRALLIASADDSESVLLVSRAAGDNGLAVLD
jgi:predicted ATPase